jgi:hypothetical protein
LQGHRFNAHKLLIDPYARAFAGAFEWSDAHYGYRAGDAAGDLSFDRRDNAGVLPKCRVIDPAYAWEGDRPPRTPWADTVIYEAHVKGFSRNNPAVPAALRGTYAGLAHAASIEHLQRLGVTAVELLPVHEMIDERRLVQGGLVNYWGYNTIGFFAPAARYAGSGAPLDEFRTRVRRLHAAGIEVILDVVYNHTGEADELGPTLAFRGIDNASYYRLREGRWQDDVSGCGNTLGSTESFAASFSASAIAWCPSLMKWPFPMNPATSALGISVLRRRFPMSAAVWATSSEMLPRSGGRGRLAQQREAAVAQFETLEDLLRELQDQALAGRDSAAFGARLATLSAQVEAMGETVAELDRAAETSSELAAFEAGK